MPGMRNIFVVGLDDFHLAQLRTLPGAEDYVFHPLFTHKELKDSDRFPVERLLEDGAERLRHFPGGVDAVVGYWDFPVSTVLPILRGAVGLPGPTLESVLKCEHKYWSRLEQAQVVPRHIPAFCAVDPFADDPLAGVTIDFPFWIKPVKAVLSYLGFRVEDADDFRRAIERIRAGIGRFGDPFNVVLEHATLPPEVAAVDGNRCIAESLISAGRQCTLEGYAWRGEVRIYGVVDSLREGAAGSSFSRYQYPSTLPEPVQARMGDIVSRVIRRIGYDDGPFNIEFYWEEDTDNIWLLEINTRISKSHAPLFRMVDGCYHHQVMIHLGLGREPVMPHREGPYAWAAKFMVRRHEDARVVRAPTRAEIDAVEAGIPGVVIQVDVDEGMRLSQLRYQDSYTYEVATVFVGAETPEELEQKYERVMARLPLAFEALEHTGS
ncbi:D-alanine--D-alanine ligase [Thioalkalivibrio denitrificans]|uniref:D-alanine--D-alanine ligase n=1 Tax=Thioalkalivibrio denitrificans TaxID=108003 RepID=A0A1V3NSN7_9GAMM|nr:ATP-grasp domain-containing protein [Thioalkalivibrio denitrificans]OOG27832.1 D-alanine--D-alanine ligase [Thioalkalivibrio denitrificans]